MCVAIYKPASKRLKYADLKECYLKNNDGMGFAAAVDGQLVTHRIVDGKFDDFWKLLKKHKENPCLIHFRWATHGDTNEDNTHPFLLNHGSIAMAHNGVIHEFVTAYGIKQKESDTFLFIQKMLQPLIADDPGLLYKKSFQRMLAMAVGSANKLAFLDSSGKAVLINKYAGSWRKGVWFSNMTWDEPIIKLLGSAPLYDTYGNWYQQPDNDSAYLECVYCGHSYGVDQMFHVGTKDGLHVCMSCQGEHRPTNTESKSLVKYNKTAAKYSRFCFYCDRNIYTVAKYYKYHNYYYCMCLDKNWVEFKADITVAEDKFRDDKLTKRITTQ